MLLAVEGGGFFSSSASGYSKGLTVLLLRQRNEEKSMRVTPWNQYQLVDQESDPDLQLASEKNRLVRGCASFVCFGRAAAGPENPSPLKVGPTQNQEVHPGLVCDGSKDETPAADLVDHDQKIINHKSSLKRPADNDPAAAACTCNRGCGNRNEHEGLCEKGDDACQVERRKVQWTDTIGGELVEIREFEMSDNESDDEFDHGNQKTCSCTIM